MHDALIFSKYRRDDLSVHIYSPFVTSYDQQDAITHVTGLR